jgi:hypothetical protein
MPERIFMKTLVKMNFNPEIAAEVGTDAAIIFENIVYWIHKNMTQQMNKEKQPSFQEGRWWTYNSRAAFSIQFTWLTDGKIRVCLDKLKEKNYIKTGIFNKNKYDHTTWYALGENEIATRLIGEMNQSIGGMTQSIGEQNQSIGGYNQPIPNSNTDVKRERGSLSKIVLEGKEIHELQKTVGVRETALKRVAKKYRLRQEERGKTPTKQGLMKWFLDEDWKESDYLSPNEKYKRKLITKEEWMNEVAEGWGV